MSDVTDGFRLAYDRAGAGPPAVLLHGWPGDRRDYRQVAPRLTGLDVVVPDLRGFGESDKQLADPAAAYSAAAQARSVIALIEELGLRDVVIAGYDIGSRIAQTVAAARPGLVRGLVVAPPLPGIGARILGADAQREFWYQSFHQLALAAELIDGRPGPVRAYLAYFWSHWSGPSFRLADADLDHLVESYGRPGAFTASIGWYRAGAGSVARSLAEQAPPPAGCTCRSRCSGPGTTRCSRSRGRTGLMTSSTMRRCGCCRRLVISRRWRHRTSSRRRSWRRRAWPATAGSEAPCASA